MSTVKEYIRFLKYAPNLMMVILWGFYIVGYLRGLVLFTPGLSEMPELVEGVYIFLPIILSLPFILKQTVVRKCMAIYLVLCIVYLINIVVYPENSALLDKNLVRCLFTSYPFIFFGCLIDIRRYFNAFYITSILCLCLDIFYFLIFNSSNVDVSAMKSDHNMGAAYALLPHTLICIVAALQKYKTWKLVVASASVVMLLAYGTRGPIACLAFFIVAYIVFIKRVKGIKNLAVVVAGVTLLAVFYEQMLDALIYIVGDTMGMSTRVIDGIANNSIAEDEARTWIAQTLMNELANGNCTLGYGLLGAYNFTGGYPHNFFVDVLFTFGYVIGGLLLILLAVSVAKAYKRSLREERVFLLVLFSSGFMHLMFSGTFVYDADFYIFLGYVVRMLTYSPNYEGYDKGYDFFGK